MQIMQYKLVSEVDSQQIALESDPYISLISFL